MEREVSIGDRVFRVQELNQGTYARIEDETTEYGPQGSKVLLNKREQMFIAEYAHLSLEEVAKLPRKTYLKLLVEFLRDHPPLGVMMIPVAQVEEVLRASVAEETPEVQTRVLRKLRINTDFLEVNSPKKAVSGNSSPSVSE
jgi:hypothetical protein